MYGFYVLGDVVILLGRRRARELQSLTNWYIIHLILVVFKGVWIDPG
jgi:hypothetical protein